MNWIKENKFLSGFIGILIVGAGVLGYLLYTAWGTYSDVSDQYTAQADALKQLQARVPYPDQANLAKYKTERDDLIDATHDLATSLSKMVLPIVEMSPSAFQDRLRDTLSAVSAEAAQNNVKLPEHFSMDFERYQTSPPSAEAAGPLGRQMAALKIVMDILIHEHVDTVISLQRTPLPQEAAAAAPSRERGDAPVPKMPGRPGASSRNIPSRSSLAPISRLSKRCSTTWRLRPINSSSPARCWSKTATPSRSRSRFPGLPHPRRPSLPPDPMRSQAAVF